MTASSRVAPTLSSPRTLAVLVGLAALGCQSQRPSSVDMGAPDLAGCVGAACMPSDGCPADSPTTLVGNVFAPNGLDPVPHATVWVPAGALPAPKTGLSCDVCTSGSPDGAAVYGATRTDGFFTIASPPTGPVTVVAELGRFRRVTSMTIKKCMQNAVPPDAGSAGLRLPGKDLALGPDDRAPHIAVASGDYDQIECVLKRMGIEQFDLYNDRGPGVTLPATIGELDALLSDPAKLATYQILVVNCTNAQFESSLAKPAVLTNIEAFVGAGGRLYATDWAYDMIQQVPAFAPYVCFVAGGVDGPPPDPSCSGTPMSPKVAQSTNHYDTNGQIEDMDLLSWLMQLPGALISGVVPIQYNFVVVNQLGDMMHPVKTWVKGDAADPSALPMLAKGTRPLTVTFDYKQCGRVHYSTYNTEPSDVVADTMTARYPSCGNRSSFNPQERLLEYLIFEVAQCIGTVL